MFSFSEVWGYIFHFIRAWFLFWLLGCCLVGSRRSEGPWSVRCTPGSRLVYRNIHVAVFALASLTWKKSCSKNSQVCLVIHLVVIWQPSSMWDQLISILQSKFCSHCTRPTLVSFRHVHPQMLWHWLRSAGWWRNSGGNSYLGGFFPSFLLLFFGVRVHCCRC